MEFISHNPTDFAILPVIFGVIGLAWGYDFGAESDRIFDGTGTGSGWSDLGLVVLLAALSSSLPAWFVPPSGALDLVQVALVAVAVAFGSGPALLAGGPGIAIGTALGYGGYDLWYLFVVTASGGLEGVVTGWLASGIRLTRLLAAVVGVAALGLLPFLTLFGLGSPFIQSAAIQMLLSAALGIVIGLLVRIARARWNGKDGTAVTGR